MASIVYYLEQLAHLYLNRHLPHRLSQVARALRGRDQALAGRHARHWPERRLRRAEAGRRVLLSHLRAAVCLLSVLRAAGRPSCTHRVRVGACTRSASRLFAMSIRSVSTVVNLAVCK